MIRHNHFDVAFEEFLRSHRIPYVAVDEARRAMLGQASLKSFDFVVVTPQGTRLLVDVKGRQGRSGVAADHRWRENWVTHDDIDSLIQWEAAFGPGFQAMFVFAYPRRQPAAGVASRYEFFALPVRDFAAAMRQRSERWQTVSLTAADFRRLRIPCLDLLLAPAVAAVPIGQTAQ